MADDDRRPVEPADDLLVVVDDVRDAEIPERRWVTAELLGLALESGPRFRNDCVALVPVALGPVLPAERRHPHSVNQHDRLSAGRIRSSRIHGASLDSNDPLQARPTASYPITQRWTCPRRVASDANLEAWRLCRDAVAALRFASGDERQ